VVEIAEVLKVLNGTIASPAAPVLLEIMAPGTDVPGELVPRTVTPLVGALELPRIMFCPLFAPVTLLELAAVGFDVVVSLVPESSSVSVLELVLEIPGSAEIVDPGVTKLAVLDPVVEPTPPIMPVVELGAAAVLESVVLSIPADISPAVGTNVLVSSAVLAASAVLAPPDPEELAVVDKTGWATGWATLDAR
jgi:hypothetical protein